VQVVASPARKSPSRDEWLRHLQEAVPLYDQGAAGRSAMLETLVPLHQRMKDGVGDELLRVRHMCNTLPHTSTYAGKSVAKLADETDNEVDEEFRLRSDVHAITNSLSLRLLARFTVLHVHVSVLHVPKRSTYSILHTLCILVVGGRAEGVGSFAASHV
jgi:hypothetical protein